MCFCFWGFFNLQKILTLTLKKALGGLRPLSSRWIGSSGGLRPSEPPRQAPPRRSPLRRRGEPRGRARGRVATPTALRAPPPGRAPPPPLAPRPSPPAAGRTPKRARARCCHPPAILRPAPPVVGVWNRQLAPPSRGRARPGGGGGGSQAHPGGRPRAAGHAGSPTSPCLGWRSGLPRLTDNERPSSLSSSPDNPARGAEGSS